MRVNYACCVAMMPDGCLSANCPYLESSEPEWKRGGNARVTRFYPDMFITYPFVSQHCALDRFSFRTDGNSDPTICSDPRPSMGFCFGTLSIYYVRKYRGTFFIFLFNPSCTSPPFRNTSDPYSLFASVHTQTVDGPSP